MSALLSFPKIAAVSFGAGGTGTVVSWDMSAPGLGLPVLDNCSLSVTGELVGYSTANDYGRIVLVSDYKRVAGTLSQLSVSTTTYNFFDPAMATAVGAFNLTGNSIRIQLTTGAVAANWTGTIWLSSSTF